MNFGEIGVSGVILLVIIAFAAFGFAKGALKLLYGFLCLIGTLAAAWAGYTFGYPALLTEWPSMPKHGEYACALAAAILTFILLKTVTDFFANPFENEEQRSKSSGLTGLITGFAMGFAICLLCLNKLVDKGTRAEIDYWIAQATEAAPQELPNLAKLKHDILHSPVSKQVTSLLSFNNAASQNLSKLVIMQVAAPEKIQQLSQDPAIALTLQSPKLKAFLHSPEIKQSIESGDTAAVATHPDFIALLKDPAMNDAIAQIDIEHALKLR
ncbi:hypothetical protein ACFPK9_03780 [Rubritalea spongiae]|uniref:CvpA family protein n=1 Tax=Rubritalea spongiae TaxID=430797 RepID=A0ABW5E4S5_9BACT